MNVQLTVEAKIVQQLFICKALQEAEVEHFCEIVSQRGVDRGQIADRGEISPMPHIRWVTLRTFRRAPFYLFLHHALSERAAHR